MVHERYKEVREHVYVEKDEPDNEYLCHRDDSREGQVIGGSRH